MTTASSDAVYLVSCVKTKLTGPARAKDLYVSPWFRLARAYVERTGQPWFILSAEYGLLDPDQVIAPYDRTLVHMPADERRAWATKVESQMDVRLPKTRRIVVMAGHRYRAHLLEYLERRASIEIPLEGLGLGRQLQWLSSHAAT
jgi:hypothetical protein